jgi:2-methylcitrate dehydratase PrpD
MYLEFSVPLAVDKLLDLNVDQLTHAVAVTPSAATRLATHYPFGHHKNRVSDEQMQQKFRRLGGPMRKMEMQNAVIEAGRSIAKVGEEFRHLRIAVTRDVNQRDCRVTCRRP